MVVQALELLYRVSITNAQGDEHNQLQLAKSF